MQSRHKRLAVSGGAAIVTGALVTAALVTYTAPGATAAVVTVAPASDTYVTETNPRTNYGTATTVTVDRTPAARSFTKFTVSGLTEPVASATLRLHVASNGGSKNAGSLQLTSNTAWSETGLTWSNQPAIDGAVIASVGKVTANTWVELDVTAGITGNGTYSIAGISNNADDAIFDSRESANPPQLVITTSTTPPPDPSGEIFVGAGDIAGSGSGDSATAALISALPSTATVWAAGDNAYDSGTLTEYNTWYHPTWGQFKNRTIPAPGNHEYGTSGASGYFDYFGALAGPNRNGWFSKDIGDWHVISLNSEVSTSAGSPQETWLRQDLAANTKLCTIAMWHSPLFTSGSHSPDTAMRPLFQALYDYNADVVITGHNHNYERFAPMNPSGQVDTARGIRHFVNGAGGRSHYNFTSIAANSEARNSDTYGVLKFTLKASSYDWEFIPEAGKTFRDSGTTACH
ncbi:alkaline phosphatase [Nocardioides immobilis]|uniref:Alkaline phosphatase n=1 Tax=Nocardioides immobilis TaxID=2049295 RepID=A0A417XSJ4_9ACTN|nr:DNRLRE domain-containing protein [Nocardioides immobilis]RHW23428.1 alkaline phosphatase [Nocardioides immobilis]